MDEYIRFCKETLTRIIEKDDEKHRRERFPARFESNVPGAYAMGRAGIVDDTTMGSEEEQMEACFLQYLTKPLVSQTQIVRAAKSSRKQTNNTHSNEMIARQNPLTLATMHRFPPLHITKVKSKSSAQSYK